ADPGDRWARRSSSLECYAVEKGPPSQLVHSVPGSDAAPTAITMPGFAAGVALGGGAIWVANVLEPVAIYRIDPSTRRVVASIATGHPISGALTYLGNTLWVANRDGYVTRIDSQTNRAVSFEVDRKSTRLN